MLRDLHSHTIASDGSLSVSELLRAASERGVNQLAITDHDSVESIAEAVASTENPELTVIPGVEISAAVGKNGKDTVHVVGLNIDHTHNGLTSFLKAVQKKRHTRALEMAHKLEQSGVAGVTADVEYMLDSQSMVCRTHLAQYLIDQGVVKNFAGAFKQYLAKGGKAYCKDDWFDIEDAVAMINQSGGTAVLAHPTRYQMGSNKLKNLIEHFAQVGGKAIEVCYPNIHPGHKNLLADWSVKYDLLASQGSDFHSPDKPWALLGKFPPLPEHVTPVWQSDNWVKE